MFVEMLESSLTLIHMIKLEDHLIFDYNENSSERKKNSLLVFNQNI